MKGQPKYNLGQRVEFDSIDRVYVGEIYIIDPFGTFEDSSDVSYDIFVEDCYGGCLYKHIRETNVRPL